MMLHEDSPPPSQPRPPARDTNENNPPEQKQPEKKRDKMKIYGPSINGGKIVKIENSIVKLERHLKNWTCPKSLQYSARANIASDSAFQKEIRTLSKLPNRHLLMPSHASINEGLTALDTNLRLGLHFRLKDVLM